MTTKAMLLCAALFRCGNTAPPPPPPPPAQASATASVSAPEPSASATTSPRHIPRTKDRFVGSISRDTVQRIVRVNLVTVKKCYAQALHRDPTIQGRYTARFVIDERGDVETAVPDPSKTTITDSDLIGCITGVFKSLRFPQPEGGYVVIVYPLDLVPKDDGTVSPTPSPPPP